MMSKSLCVAHGLNIAAWACVIFTLLTVTTLGKPAFLGCCLAIPLFAASLQCYNAAVRAGGIVGGGPLPCSTRITLPPAEQGPAADGGGM